MCCLGHKQTPNIQSSASADLFRGTISQECQTLAPGRVNREKQSRNVAGLKRILTFLCTCRAWQHWGAAGCLVDCPFTLSQLVCQIWFGIWEIPAGFDREARLPGWPGLCVRPGHSRMLSLGQLSCKGFWSLLESEPGLLSSVWNPWHSTPWAARSLLLQQMEFIPSQPLLCKHSQEQPPHQQCCCCCHWLTTASQTPHHGQGPITGNVLVPIPAGPGRIPKVKKEPSPLVGEIKPALFLPKNGLGHPSWGVGGGMVDLKAPGCLQLLAVPDILSAGWIPQNSGVGASSLQTSCTISL